MPQWLAGAAAATRSRKDCWAGLRWLPDASEEVSRGSFSDGRHTSSVRAAARRWGVNGERLRGINEASQASRSNDDLLSGEPLNQNHGTATERTIPGRRGRLSGRGRRARKGLRRRGQQLLTVGQQRPPSMGQEPEEANADEPLRQNMQHKPRRNWLALTVIFRFLLPWA